MLLYDTGQNLLIVSAHYFNWEIANAGTALSIKYPLVTAYNCRWKIKHLIN